jgi:hypothetical protein
MLGTNCCTQDADNKYKKAQKDLDELVSSMEGL